MIKKEVIDKLNKLMDEVNAFYEDDEFKGYKASPLLKEIINLIKDNNDDEKETLKTQYNSYIFIAEAYKRMGRPSLAAIYHQKALETALSIYCQYGEKSNNILSLLHSVISERNYYVDDDCKDIVQKVKDTNVLDSDEIEKFATKTLARRRSFKNDPVEMNEAYLAVIDEVEERIDKNRTIFGMGACFEIWNLKSQYLAEKGIMWSSPAILNPRVMFD